jgi:ankyrin repeat protein
MWAAANGNKDTVSALLNAGGDPTMKDSEGKTALALAQESKQASTEQVLKAYPARGAGH